MISSFGVDLEVCGLGLGSGGFGQCPGLPVERSCVVSQTTAISHTTQ